MVVCRISRSWIRDEERKVKEEHDELLAYCQVMNPDEKLIRDIDRVNTKCLTLGRMYKWKTVVHKKTN